MRKEAFSPAPDGRRKIPIPAHALRIPSPRDLGAHGDHLAHCGVLLAVDLRGGACRTSVAVIPTEHQALRPSAAWPAGGVRPIRFGTCQQRELTLITLTSPACWMRLHACGDRRPTNCRSGAGDRQEDLLIVRFACRRSFCLRTLEPDQTGTFTSSGPRATRAVTWSRLFRCPAGILREHLARVGRGVDLADNRAAKPCAFRSTAACCLAEECRDRLLEGLSPEATPIGPSCRARRWRCRRVLPRLPGGLPIWMTWFDCTPKPAPERDGLGSPSSRPCSGRWPRAARDAIVIVEPWGRRVPPIGPLPEDDSPRA
jgi:hypothetical protein